MSCQSYSTTHPTNPTNNVDAIAGVAVKVVAFLCNWCSYAGADKAGANQLPVPAELTAIRVMCSGRVEPTMILECFQKGADGVLVLACHPGDCHYKEGNLRAYCRAELLERLVPQLGVDPRRFRFDYVSAAEADRFSQITNEFVDQVRALAVRPFKN
ncbi:MAG: hydrogenase iron-sulfur subunit [Candidatus Accumulibacter sp.]|jgi:F420-non-reducing hydrogenase iron-sulfur subunit|nr:hydrogenase iron-sulfur subunit [Accumulibacter sp.]MBK8579731.1 hydrogenase iron-sulfur subunit [Candidatus Accumulibacter propinquus]